MKKLKCNECGKKFDSLEAFKQHKKDVHSKEIKLISKKRLKELSIYTIIFFLSFSIAYGAYNVIKSYPKIGPLGSTHIHADIKVYVNGNPIDFSQPKYQLRSKYVHFENGDGNVVHVHAKGVTINFMLNTLGMNLDSKCLTIDSQKFCNQGNKSIKFFVNGKRNYEFGNYVIKDLDKILISYGDENESEIIYQLNSITNLACKESKRC